MKDYSKLTALIVEDDQTNQVITETLLKRIGIASRIANTGEEAIEILKANDYDFTLMDISLPGADGLDTGRWIREYSDSNDRFMPIFALTSFSSNQHTEEIKNAGINEHLKKPFSLEQLLPLLDKYFWQRIGK